ncbi:hypothetical protein L1887_09816 [Cichorium endivia]|nr:hypothetical protein L1887_09816 [Cichorium endivia]
MVEGVNFSEDISLIVSSHDRQSFKYQGRFYDSYSVVRVLQFRGCFDILLQLKLVAHHLFGIMPTHARDQLSLQHIIHENFGPQVTHREKNSTYYSFTI